MKSQPDIQERFLSALCEQRIPTSVYMRSGIRLQGTVDGFDRYTLRLKNVTTQVVYKHAISTIVPSRNVQISLPSEESE